MPNECVAFEHLKTIFCFLYVLRYFANYQINIKSLSFQMASGRTLPVKTSRISLPELPTPFQSLMVSNCDNNKKTECKIPSTGLHIYNNPISTLQIKYILKSNSSMQKKNKCIKAATIAEDKQCRQA